MAGKLLKMKRGTKALGGTDSVSHPGSFPLGSLESRVAARAMIGPDRLRAGDTGVEKDGSSWVVIHDEDRDCLVQIVFPKDFSAEAAKE
jgi:hypothetical protein